VLSVIGFLADKGAQTAAKTECFAFGDLAIMVTQLRNGRPMALRPCLSTGLPLSNK